MTFSFDIIIFSFLSFLVVFVYLNLTKPIIGYFYSLVKDFLYFFSIFLSFFDFYSYSDRIYRKIFILINVSWHPSPNASQVTHVSADASRRPSTRQPCQQKIRLISSTAEWKVEIWYLVDLEFLLSTRVNKESKYQERFFKTKKRTRRRELLSISQYIGREMRNGFRINKKFGISLRLSSTS